MNADGNASATELLKLLLDGEFHSGEAIAGRLGISRAAVWKKIGQLQGRGLSIERSRGKGYRLIDGIELLDNQQIVDRLSAVARSAVSRVQVCDVVTSTNDVCLQGLAQGGLRHAAVVVAERQTSGRGRRGRAWVSPYGSNVYLSLTWQFDVGIALLEGLSLAVGIAVLQALRHFGVQVAGLKWPNDIVVDDAKLGGVLIEMRGDLDGPISTVIGIGINVRMPKSSITEIDQKWTDLWSIMQPQTQILISRNALIAELVNQTVVILKRFSEAGLGACLEDWDDVDAIRGRHVTISSGERNLEGVANGVDASGALRLVTNDGTLSIRSGEVTLRLAN
jgi:BirA family transcriptional regulator, biotin operon repressor / biotin---[acetyl-CoA-carboxylase] ligase